jgi:hypothetical protein
MRHEALPFLLPALQSLPPLLGTLFAEFGHSAAVARAQRGFLRQVIPAVDYTREMIAPPLQAQLRPWLRELVEAPALTAQVAQQLAREAPTAVQEALHWAYSFEAGTRLSASRGGETRDLRALFVPLVVETPNWAPLLPPSLVQALRELMYARGLVQADEAVLVAPPSLPPRALTRMASLAELLRFALDAAQAAWGEGAAAAADCRGRWDSVWQRAAAPHGVPTLRPLELRFALLVVVSPEPAHAVLDDLLPWQEEARTQLLLSDRFDSGSLIEFESDAELDAHAHDALDGWLELVNARLEDAEIPVAVAGPPSDAYSACGRAALEAAAQMLARQALDEALDVPVFLLADTGGLAVELGGASQRLPWAPLGALMPAMLPPLEEALHAESGRQLERASTQDLNRLALIGADGSGLV